MIAGLETRAETGRLQRAAGSGHVAMGPGGRLTGLRQEGCAHIRVPRDAGAPLPTAILINAAGGLTGGDRLSWSAETAMGGGLTVTTQACERIYRALGDAPATAGVTLQASAGSRLHWLPQETILFEGGRLERRIEADIAERAEIILCEAVILGRTARGETVRSGRLKDRWRVRREGRLVFAEDCELTGAIDAIGARSAALAGARAFASVLMVGPDADTRLDAARTALGDAGGASAWDGKLFARLTAPDGLALRRSLLPLIAALTGAPPPRAWMF